MLELKAAGKKYDDRWLFKNLNLSAQAGEFISILGPSGCGKSTLLRILAGLDHLSEGQFTNLTTKTPGFVFQDSYLLPWLTVFENVAIGLGQTSLSAIEAKKQILKSLDTVKLSEWSNHFPHQLSGGMRMRVSIARALVNNKAVLFMDEPFAALDDFIRFELQEELLNIWKNNQITIFFVTHSLNESIFLSQKLWLFPQTPHAQFQEQILKKPPISPADYRKSDAYFKKVNELSDSLRATR